MQPLLGMRLEVLFGLGMKAALEGAGYVRVQCLTVLSHATLHII